MIFVTGGTGYVGGYVVSRLLETHRAEVMLLVRAKTRGQAVEKLWNGLQLHMDEARFEKVLPLVRSTATLNDPVPLPVAVHTLFRFLLRATGATDGVLIVRSLSNDGTDFTHCYAPTGEPLPTPSVPFSRSLAANVVSMQDPCVMNDFDPASAGIVDLMPFERNRKSILAAPVRVGSGTHVVLELFDKPVFTEEDRRLVAAAADIGAELLKQAFAERQTHSLLFDAVEAALTASDNVTRTLNTTPDTPAYTRPDTSAIVMERLKLGLAANTNAVIDAETGLKLVEAVRTLATRHGTAPVEHCVLLVNNLRELLDGITGTE